MIPLPRLQAIPETRLCAACATKSSRNLSQPQPPPPPGSRTCPRCGNPTIVRQNKEDQSFFLGCMNFPRCHGQRISPIERYTIVARIA
ncbi:MAG: topoisomerase DNA-binding C4 zinc finger domain-containing protein [Methylobacteriaceae bacterium]|nr:topoisomerase DNA-binding C4 zinc finger domain-containing protein [Methylobacteriaceae bacterium]